MTEPRCRPFLMSDAMILIAATAVGLAQVRVFSTELGRGSPWVWLPFVLAITMLPAWSISLAALRLRRPWPPWDNLPREPGWIACMLGGIPSTILPLVAAFCRAAGLGGDDLGTAYAIGWLLGSFSVSAVWALMWSVCGWKPQPGWIDRCGIVIGFLWVSLLGIPTFLWLVFLLYSVLMALVSRIA